MLAQQSSMRLEGNVAFKKPEMVASSGAVSTVPEESPFPVGNSSTEESCQELLDRMTGQGHGAEGEHKGSSEAPTHPMRCQAARSTM